METFNSRFQQFNKPCKIHLCFFFYFATAFSSFCEPTEILPTVVTDRHGKSPPDDFQSPHDCDYLATKSVPL